MATTENRYSRRELLQLGGALAAAGGLSAGFAEVFAEGIARLACGLPRVVWLQGQACGGCTVSLLNADRPPLVEAIVNRVSLAFHPALSAAQGGLAMEVLGEVEKSTEPLVLVVEGAVPVKTPQACRIAGRPLVEVLLPLVRRAAFILGAGTCASYGGIPSGEGNPTGAVSVREFMEKAGLTVKGRLVNCPGCPCHPGEMLGTLLHLAGKGYPEVRPASLTPTMFSVGCLHNECPRVSSFTMRIFAMQFGDGDGCLYQLGCRGLDVYADCARRRWNGGVNWCIQASAPCIACNQPEFGKSRSTAFYNSSDSPR